MFTVLLTHLPQFTDRYHLSDGSVTLIVLTVTVLAGVGSLFSEVLAGAASSRTALRCGLLVVALAGTVIALAPGRVIFVTGFAVYGIGVGAVDAAGNMQAVAVQHRYGRSIITSFHAAWSAAAIAGALSVSGGERLRIPLAASILPAAAVVLLIALVAGPALLPRARSATAPDLGPADPPQPGTSSGASPGSAWDDPRVTVVRGPLLLLGLAMTCFWAVDSGVSNWSALYLRDLLGAANSTAALGYAFYQSMALVSRLSGDLAVRRFGAGTAVRAGAILGTAGTALVALAPGPTVAILGFGLAGLGLPVVAPLCFSAAGAVVRAKQRNAGPQDEVAAVDSAVARLNVFNYLGSLLGAVVIGGVATVSDLRAGFVVPVLLAAILFFLARAFAPASAPAFRSHPPDAGTEPGRRSTSADPHR